MECSCGEHSLGVSGTRCQCSGGVTSVPDMVRIVRALPDVAYPVFLTLISSGPQPQAVNRRQHTVGCGRYKTLAAGQIGRRHAAAANSEL